MTAATEATEVIERARKLGLYIAVAESLTGGMLSAALVDVSGASEVFVGGIVSYHTELKHTLLSVDEKLLDEQGPVHPLVAEQMALGVRVTCATHRASDGHPVHPDLAVAVTGVAGPNPDLISGQEPGTVWIGVSSRLGERSEKFQFSGDRDEVRQHTVDAALRLLNEEISLLTP